MCIQFRMEMYINIILTLCFMVMDFTCNANFKKFVVNTTTFYSLIGELQSDPASYRIIKEIHFGM